MRVILFGATGMVGQGALRECLLDPGVESVLSVGRRPLGRSEPKLQELVLESLTDYSGQLEALRGYDACFWCLGISSTGLSEAEYTRTTYELTVAAAEPLAKLNPNLTFIFVSGAGSDGSGQSKTMWARVKGRAENAVLALPFRGYVFRPAMIEPLHGISSRTKLYRVLYVLLAPVFPIARRFFPKYVTTTESVGRAMLAVARNGAPKRVLENADIDAIGRSAESTSIAPAAT